MGLNNFDDLVIVGKTIFYRCDGSVHGCYRDGLEVLKKDMTKAEMGRAQADHIEMRKHTFDIVGEENKGE